MKGMRGYKKFTGIVPADYELIVASQVVVKAVAMRKLLLEMIKLSY